ncbi:V [Polar bear adenovirus 1]|uniref:V n=1 Tax=Polar bear adenovirus 1 TaxID=2250215 RepID=A0A2Z4QJF3_9ADEN|nr:V [Polar bear mastadenovirus 1] [Polar bear adenovirus 1]AWY10561.1 pV [Polar bear adenovirus 1]AXI68656.1 V [Polar bear mastadenovirus 1] [Polar bear adenovirus 1]
MIKIQNFHFDVQCVIMTMGTSTAMIKEEIEGLDAISSTRPHLIKRANKRSMDEMFADEDILEMLQKGEGEFAYGKRAKYSFAPLTEHNPTPSLTPATDQHVLPISGSDTQLHTLQPTIQILIPKRKAPAGNSGYPRVKRRRATPITSDISVETVDVEVPDRGKIPKYWLHPSMIVDKIGKTRQRRRRRRRRRRRIKNQIPNVWYHPSIKIENPKIPRGVRYHPSITM